MLSRSSLMVLIVILSLFGPLSTDMYLSGLPVMVDEFGTNETVMNITLYAFMLSMAVSTLFLGPISDKYGRRKTLLATMAIYIVSSFACCIAHSSWAAFMIAMIPVSAVAMVGRSYGFDILMNQNDEDTGAVSSILNFSSFGLACVGMVIASMPWDDFITGIEVALVLCCGIYIVTWAVMHHGRYPLRGLED